MSLRTASLVLFLFLASAFPLVLQAQSLSPGPELEVYLSREISDWRIEDGPTVETRVNRVGLSIRDHVAEGLWIGLHGGYLSLSQSGNSATQGMDLSGWYLGTSARWRFLRVGAVSMNLSGRYTYHEADDRVGDQDTRYSWHQYGAGVESVIRGESLALRLGADYTAIDGDERARGPIRHTRSLSEDEAVTVRAALDLLVDATGRISFQVEAGARRGAGVQFARQF
ncbi:hypothetical protein B1C78_07205 [Thioalkalivibrio denitrificans]|uniref:Outer membrane protein beta-barrel domain-containing protein n=1 Tax=Thioalkalivibrio denitrificans TaxID=108003 RepID=A0A1V3NJX1_9GAMM|nr:hypothetical protein [Thioalkalivibrio denitrificans]OOG25198.1 hypothetical protein B1C78_07205 [Thioalkalivibrio denitrificans]